MTGSVGDDPKPTEYGSTHAVLIKGEEKGR